MNFLLFLAPFSWGTQKREAAAPKASGCFMGGTCVVREEPGKQKPRSCRAQELARSSARENEWRKKIIYRIQREIGVGNRFRAANAASVSLASRLEGRVLETRLDGKRSRINVFISNML